MLKLNVNEEKQLTFEVQIGGVNYDQVTSHLRIVIGEVEYGFPARVGNESITVDLPPLNKIIGTKLKEGEEVEVKLEMIADGYYLTPWQDTLKISNPLVIEAKIKDDGFVPNPAIKTSLVVAEDGARQITTLTEKEKEVEKPSDKEEKETDDEMLGKLAEKLVILLGKQEGKIIEQDEEEISPGELGSKVGRAAGEAAASAIGTKEKANENKMGAIEKLLTDTVNKIQTEGKTTPKRKINLQELKQNITKEDVIKYMENAGTKNSKIQEIIYEQASTASGKDTPFDTLRQVVKIMKKK